MGSGWKKKLIPVNNREQRLKSRIIPSGKSSNQNEKKVTLGKLPEAAVSAR